MLGFLLSRSGTMTTRWPLRGHVVAIEPIEQRLRRIAGLGDADNGFTIAGIVGVEVRKTIVGIQEFVPPLGIGGGAE